jgi:hypothetical protein
MWGNFWAERLHHIYLVIGYSLLSVFVSDIFVTIENSEYHGDSRSNEKSLHTLESAMFAENNSEFNDDDDDDDNSVVASTTDAEGREEEKKEKMFVKVVRNIRKKFTARKLIGRIYVYRVSGFVSAAMRCNITEAHYQQRRGLLTPSASFSGEFPGPQESLNDLSSSCQKAVTMTDSILDSLERRAMGWEGSSEIDQEIMLTRGAKFGFRGPYLGIIGYQIILEISASIQSLIISRKRLETQKLLDQQNQYPETRTSFSARNKSFSFFSRQSFSQQLAAPLRDTIIVTSNSPRKAPTSPKEKERSDGINSGSSSRSVVTGPIEPQLVESNSNDEEEDPEDRLSLVMI